MALRIPYNLMSTNAKGMKPCTDCTEPCHKFVPSSAPNRSRLRFILHPESSLPAFPRFEALEFCAKFTQALVLHIFSVAPCTESLQCSLEAGSAERTHIVLSVVYQALQQHASIGSMYSQPLLGAFIVHLRLIWRL